MVKLAALAGLLLAACTAVKTQRAALVPHQQPIMRSGQPGEGKGEFALGSSAISLGEPELAPGVNSGLYIPSVHVTGAVRLRPSPNLDIGFLWDHGLRKGADAIQPGQPPLDDGDVMGGGLSMFYSASAGDPNFRIGIGADLLFYSVPWVEYTSCFENCPVPWTVVDHERSTVPVFAVGVLPSYKVTPQLALFAGLTVRNHPTIKRVEIENPVDALFDDGDPEAGPANFIGSAGIEATLGAGIRGSAVVYQPIQAEPARYKPAVGFMLTIPFGRDAAPAGAAAVAPPPPPGPGPAPAPYPPPPPPPQ